MLFEFQLNARHGFDPLLTGGDERENILARGLTCIDDKFGMFFCNQGVVLYLISGPEILDAYSLFYRLFLSLLIGCMPAKFFQ